MSKKIVLKCFFCIALASCLLSCENKAIDYGLDKYYVEIVTVQSATVFLSDAGNKIIATSDDNERDYTAGDRVLLNYTLIETSASGDYNVRINGSTKIPQGRITLADDSTIQSSAKEPILLESVWLGSHYLNMQFYFDYKSITHKIGLLADSTRLDSDTLRMFFTHDINNDPPGYPIRAYLSFDLNDILGDPGKAHPISVQINTSDYGNKVYTFKY